MKTLRSSNEGDLLPKGVSLAVLVFAAVAAVFYWLVALVRHGRTIGRLTDEELLEGFANLKELPWLPEPIRRLFAEVQTMLSV